MAGELVRITNGCNPAGDRRRLDGARCLKGDECGNRLGGCWKFRNFSFVAPGPENLEICAVGAASSFGFLGAREGDGGGDLRSGRDGCRRGDRSPREGGLCRMASSGRYWVRESALSEAILLGGWVVAVTRRCKPGLSEKRKPIEVRIVDLWQR